MQHFLRRNILPANKNRMCAAGNDRANLGWIAANSLIFRQHDPTVFPTGFQPDDIVLVAGKVVIMDLDVNSRRA